MGNHTSTLRWEGMEVFYCGYPDKSTRNGGFRDIRYRKIHNTVLIYSFLAIVVTQVGKCKLKRSEDVDAMVFLCWTSVADGYHGPTLK